MIAVDISRPGALREVIPEAAEAIATEEAAYGTNVSLVGDRFFVTYIREAHNRVRVFDLTGRLLREIPLPGIGSTSGFGASRKSRQVFYDYSAQRGEQPVGHGARVH